MVSKSPLGEYVHRTGRAYIEYGVTQRGPKTFMNWSAARKEINKRVQLKDDTAIKESAKILTQRIKELIEVERNQKTLMTDNTLEQVRGEILKVVGDTIGDRFSKVEEKRTLVSTAKQNTKELMTDILNTTSRGEWAKNTNITMNDIMKARQETESILKKIDSNINRINKKGKATEKDLEKMISLFNEASGSNNTIDTMQYKKNVKTLNGKIKNIADMAHSLRNSTIMSHVTGKWGETLVSTCMDNAIWNGYDVFEEDIKALNKKIKEDMRTGEKRSEIIVSAEFKKEKDRYKQVNKDKEETDEVKNEYGIASTQDKTDVSISIKDVDLNISVKTYSQEENGLKNPHLQDVSLYTSLMYLKEQVISDFGNHWLNLHCANFENINIEEEKRVADDILKSEVAYEALVIGNPYKGNVTKAEVFTYIDRIKGEVLVATSKDLMENRDYVFNGLNAIDNWRFNHTPGQYPSHEKYVIDILNKVHETKLGIGMYVGSMMKSAKAATSKNPMAGKMFI